MLFLGSTLTAPDTNPVKILMGSVAVLKVGMVEVYTWIQLLTLFRTVVTSSFSAN